MVLASRSSIARSRACRAVGCGRSLHRGAAVDGYSATTNLDHLVGGHGDGGGENNVDVMVFAGLRYRL